MPTAAEQYIAQAKTFNGQREKFYGRALRTEAAPSFARGGRGVADPNRALDPQTEMIASYIQPDDVVVDVGGGAGRLSLLLASRSKEAINVDMSASMGAQFTDIAKESGINNARFVQGDWMSVSGVEGDVVLMASVTYFVHDIVPFIKKWQDAARRRVIISVAALSSRDLNAGLYQTVFDEELRVAPAFKELLSALWEMDIYPEVRIPPTGGRRDMTLPQTRDEATQWALQQLPVEAPADGAAKVEAHFDELFASSPNGFRPLWRPRDRSFLVTWEVERN